MPSVSNSIRLVANPHRRVGEVDVRPVRIHDFKYYRTIDHRIALRCIVAAKKNWLSSDLAAERVAVVLPRLSASSDGGSRIPYPLLPFGLRATKQSRGYSVRRGCAVQA